ncbi:hypothetical protein NE237_018622 [Protea cynaroides]|uniref:Glycoside hydrolase family 19 catalytic domain-containing protein n=1 Tax=Protea cynaroides TaxID=273540 RepID=A0A9Q0KA64_9MAGN|nr:hypothetical protein NE237_018622 [Protea cynaroides]
MGSSFRTVMAIVLVMAAASIFGTVNGEKKCNEGWECKGSIYCCNMTISKFFDSDMFEILFPMRNSPVAQAVDFWDYQSFITASALFQPLGFGTTGGKSMQMKEVAAFLAHVGSQTSCGNAASLRGPYAWGLCYNHEMSPSQSYCDPNYIYPCAPGAQYYGRGALPVYWNYNYGIIGKGLKIDLLEHPEYLEQNATIAFQSAMWRWMNSVKKNQPSAHEVFVGHWKPTKTDNLSNRVPGFGTTMNILEADQACGPNGNMDTMNSIINFYLNYLDFMGIGQDQAGPYEDLTCAQQVPFNPSSSSS